MNRYKAVFRNQHVILPVIHVDTLDKAVANATIAREAGCNGVFLINHGMSYRRLLDVHHIVFTNFPNWWIGVNCLDLPPNECFSRITNEVAGLWVDNAMIDERREDQPDADRIHEARIESRWQGLYFGGVAFKYQRPVQDLVRATRLAAKYMDVVTTSGPGTGQAAPVDKIKAMRKAIGDSALAIASGIAPENVNDYLDVADCFLVATGVSKSFTEFEPSRVTALVNAIRSYCPKEPLAARAISTTDTGKPVRSICFVCEWNEGRSAHLELSVRNKLKIVGSLVRVTSAGLSQGGGMNVLRKDFLLKLGIPWEDIQSHKPNVFASEQAEADLVLVAELPMKSRLLAKYPQLVGRIMTVRGFVKGLTPDNEVVSGDEALMEDAGGYDTQMKLVLYNEHERLAQQVAWRLIGMEE